MKRCNVCGHLPEANGCREDPRHPGYWICSFVSVQSGRRAGKLSEMHERLLKALSGKPGNYIMTVDDKGVAAFNRIDPEKAVDIMVDNPDARIYHCVDCLTDPDERHEGHVESVRVWLELMSGYDRTKEEGTDV